MEAALKRPVAHTADRCQLCTFSRMLRLEHYFHFICPATRNEGAGGCNECPRCMPQECKKHTSVESMIKTWILKVMTRESTLLSTAAPISPLPPPTQSQKTTDSFSRKADKRFSTLNKFRELLATSLRPSKTCHFERISSIHTDDTNVFYPFRRSSGAKSRRYSLVDWASSVESDGSTTWTRLSRKPIGRRTRTRSSSTPRLVQVCRERVRGRFELAASKSMFHSDSERCHHASRLQALDRDPT